MGLGSAVTWMLRHKIYRIQVILKMPGYGEMLSEIPKMVIVARTDLPLTTSKLASQCAHAAVSCYSLTRKTNPDFAEKYLAYGQTKIVVKCNNENALINLAQEAKKAKIISAIIEDAGRTRNQPGIKTVLGIGPARTEDIDKITKHLKLM